MYQVAIFLLLQILLYLKPATSWTFHTYKNSLNEINICPINSEALTEAQTQAGKGINKVDDYNALA